MPPPGVQVKLYRPLHAAGRPKVKPDQWERHRSAMSRPLIILLSLLATGLATTRAQTIGTDAAGRPATTNAT